MSIRIGSLFPDAITVSAYSGFGVLAENAPSSGDQGPSLGYRAEWFGSEVRFEVVTQPSHGTIQLFEDTSFIYTGDGTSDTMVVQGYIDGVELAETETLTFVPAGNIQIIESTTVAVTVSGIQIIAGPGMEVEILLTLNP
ncbi:hypothetical protein VT06_04250 [Arsukibacterium sp. MJ3]|uniref:hypothetical protein n=1 Tax=Arsukibacterium sp. MJ3 TaxID=1632859 RepID=UPI00062744A0|nr:hypothetical protein [Arsukibacterium sp. MJ3]KKO49813.1 hypothetical protein VT06_04250 [Arsukibacterium sp. MJ3]